MGLAFGIINTAQAQNCKQVPSCASLGYDRAAGDCPAGVTVLTCPFDSNYIYCPEDCRLYPLSQSQCDSIKGTCIQCGNSDYWKYESCNDGWYLGNDDCVENECGSYPSTSSSITGCSATASCKKGVSTRYRCTTCSNAYTASNNICVANTCDGFNSTSAITGCSAQSTCQAGATTKYTCTACSSGYTLSNGTCVANTCSGYNSTSSSITGCSTTSSCKKGSSTVYKCTTCASGYAVSSGKCVENPCTGYGLSSCPSYAYCDTCQSGTTTKYKVTSCSDSDYYWNGSNCVCSGSYDVCYMQNCTIYHYGDGSGYSVCDNGKTWDWSQGCVGICDPSASCVCN